VAPCVAKATDRTPISTIGHRLGTDFEAELRKLFAPESLGMNVTTKPLEALLLVSSLGNSAPKAPSILGDGFLDAMKQALSTTSQLQSESGRLSREVTFGNPTVSLEETMLAGVNSQVKHRISGDTSISQPNCPSLHGRNEHAGLKPAERGGPTSQTIVKTVGRPGKP